MILKHKTANKNKNKGMEKKRVYDFQKKKDALQLMLKDSEFNIVNTAVIMNAQNVGRELDYVLLDWKRRQPEFQWEVCARYPDCHPLVGVQTLLEPAPFNIDMCSLFRAMLDQNKEGVRDWVLATFAAGTDPRDWVPLVPGFPERTLQTWFECVWLGNVIEQVKQIVAFYAALWKLSRSLSPEQRALLEERISQSPEKADKLARASKPRRGRAAAANRASNPQH
jgi:hypothetical protein